MALILSFCGTFGKPPPLESARASPQAHRLFNTKPSASIIQTLVLHVGRSVVARTLLHLVTQTFLMPVRLHAFAALVLGNF
jgi:hypothetical protein